ncbi:Pkinase-domain-containing protein [Pholiota conissans]|uniref:non-specific serine/threonine protein kinase n=1 Tax=Pholiota conissans TaxID=109636 RepID=A0A9P6D6D6_9AGAR|nr:Pkinase-domain-containing protein [Pholiota conissans]
MTDSPDIHNPFAMRPKKPHDPKMIGLWKVGRTLGKGFSGHVRIARHSKTGQYAAIKIISKGSLASRVSLNRLADEVEHNLLAVEREIVVMKLIDHPNVMKLYDVWETSSSLYLILEYVQGGELFDYLCDNGRRPTVEALDYFQQIICAVDYCHRFNIAHRDLKLENILIDQDSNIKVADFGMATWQDYSRGKLLKTSCGSPHYAAPEIISGRPYDGAMSDIWSCGVILYALLAAKLPFDDDDCPTLLRKISIGRFEMPQDISHDAQDLISRMLTIDVKKRITMSEILRHPFFTSQPLKNPSAMLSNTNMTSLDRPIKNRSAIDPDIFANLRTLFHGVPDDELMTSLINSEKNWQKGIYHLLVSYRKRYLNLQNDAEERLELTLERTKSRQPRRKVRPSESMLPPRNDPPTPNRARDHHNELLTMTSEMSLVHVHYPTDTTPGISLSAPSPEGRGYIPQDALSSLVPPELEDEKMQVFFQQVANHLNILQARAVSVSKAGGHLGKSPSVSSSTSKNPPVLHVDIPSPIKLRYDAFKENTSNVSPSPSSPSNELGMQETKPLTLRQKRRPNTDTVDKENLLPITESDIIHRQSPLTRQTARLSDSNRLQIDTAVTRPSKLKKKRAPTNPPASPMFSEAGSSFTFQAPVGAPRRGWLDTVFKFKPTTYSLMSRHDVHTTRSECRRLLTEMNMLVSLEDAEKLGVLKCRTHQDNRDVRNAMVGLKTVKFRVELQWPPPLLCREGYIVVLVVIQEKGPLETFKAIFSRLERIWTLDDGGSMRSRTSSVVSSTPSSINAANYLSRQR